MGMTPNANRWREDVVARTRSKEPGAIGSKEADAQSAVRITQQFRERHNMTYEMDCAGTPLTLRIFFPSEGPSASWRIDASVRGGEPATATATSRAQALQFIAQSGNIGSNSAFAALDWSGVARALTEVRAL